MRDPLLDNFLSESRRLLAQTAADLRGMDRRIGMAAAAEINTCYRALHTIAGLADHLGLARIRTLAESAEALLEEMRTNRLQRGEARILALSRAVVRLQELIECLASEAVPVADDHDLLRELQAWSPRVAIRAPWRPARAPDRRVPRFSQYGNQIPSGPPASRTMHTAGHP